MRGRLDAVFFDLDGTLVLGEDAWRKAHRQAARDVGGELDNATLDRLAGVDLKTSVAAVRASTERRTDPDWVRRRLLALVAQEYRGGVMTVPGARQALRAVWVAQVPMALVTNTSRELVEIILRQLGRHWFRVVVCGDEVRAGKPAPDPYLRAADLLHVDPLWCLAVEDSEPGALSARRAGCSVRMVSGAVPEDLLASA